MAGLASQTFTCSQPSTFFEAALGEEDRQLVGAWAEAVALGQSSVPQALERIHHRVLAPAPLQAHPNNALRRVAATIAAAAWSDLSTAFSLWCHRMVMEYLGFTAPTAPVRELFLPLLYQVLRLGSTGLAPALRHGLLGTPLPVSARISGDGVVLNGKLSWASNLFEGRFVLVTAAVDALAGRRLIVAVPGDAQGLQVRPCGELLALQGTATASIHLENVHLPGEFILTDLFEAFLEQVRRPFLLLQSCCCWGLAARSLHEAQQALRGINQVFGDELNRLQRQLSSAAQRLWEWSDRSCWSRVPVREFVQLRLDALRLATAAAALESKVLGGQSYLASTATARRCLEALFLPVQSPTEAQLLWELAHPS